MENKKDVPPHLRGPMNPQPQITSQVNNARQPTYSSGGDGKIGKPIRTESRKNPASNIRGSTSYNAVDSAWSTNHPVDRGVLPINVGGPSLGKANASARPSVPFNRHGGPQAGDIQAPSAQSDAPTGRGSYSLAPHQRRSQKPTKSKASEAGPSTLNAGKITRSVKDSSPWPCTYGTCTRGFQSGKDMWSHKEKDHDWCRRCDVDCEDDIDLLFHKINSERHICCTVCGDDFRSEAGRDRHERQFHTAQQRVECPGCHMIFDSGAGLINHVYNNRCRDRSGRIQNKMNQDTLREHRAIAAMHLDAISHYRSTTGLEIEELQKMRGGTSVTDTSEGGVPLNLMDDDAPYGQLLAPLSIDPRSEEGETTAADVDETPVKGLSLELSTSSNVSGKGKGKVIDLIEGLTDLHVGSSTESTPEGPKTPAWSKKLFPDAKPTPVQRGWAQPAKPTPANRVWAQPTMPDIGRNILPVNSCQGTEYLVRTDWDNMNLERQLDGDFHCPFTNCPIHSIDINILKQHLTSGFHHGTDHRCLKCLKIFKSPAALTAHMESSSERCKIRNTSAYGHVIHVVSGGLLKVAGRDEKGRVTLEAPTMKELEESREGLPAYLDPDYPWDR